MFKQYLEMALKSNYKQEMDEYKKNPPIKKEKTSPKVKNQIQTFLRENVEDKILVRIVKTQEEPFYEIDLTSAHKESEGNTKLFNKIISDIKKYLKTLNVESDCYKLYVKNKGFI